MVVGVAAGPSGSGPAQDTTAQSTAPSRGKIQPRFLVDMKRCLLFWSAVYVHTRVRTVLDSYTTKYMLNKPSIPLRDAVFGWLVKGRFASR
jgi:hypothetical protein